MPKSSIKTPTKIGPALAGSGKTTLLWALLGEVPCIAGSRRVPGGARAQQVPGEAMWGDLLFYTYWCLVGNGWEWGTGIIINSYCGSFPHSLRLAPVSITNGFCEL